jgi:hypothetical protein
MSAMPEHLREHLRKECTDKPGECAEIIRWAVEGHELEALR